MTTYRRGAVLLLRYPDSNLITYKKRPALLIQNEAVATGIHQWIVAMITSNLARTGETRVLIRKSSPAGQAMKLLTDSVIVADNIATIHESAIDKILGYCPCMPEVDMALRKALCL